MGTVCTAPAPNTTRRTPAKKEALSDSILGQPDMHAELGVSKDTNVAAK